MLVEGGGAAGQTMDSPKYSFEWVHGIPNFWALSDQQLATSCVRIAQGRISGLRPFLRAEALRLFLLWQEALNATSRTREHGEQRAGELAALRKRTIQVLVRISLPQPEGKSGPWNARA
jgi:hypothetical protein